MNPHPFCQWISLLSPVLEVWWYKGEETEKLMELFTEIYFMTSHVVNLCELSMWSLFEKKYIL